MAEKLSHLFIFHHFLMLTLIFQGLVASESCGGEETTKATYENTMAECLHKILHSTDYISVFNYSR